MTLYRQIAAFPTVCSGERRRRYSEGGYRQGSESTLYVELPLLVKGINY